jgi:hypothetical protein
MIIVPTTPNRVRRTLSLSSQRAVHDVDGLIDLPSGTSAPVMPLAA